MRCESNVFLVVCMLLLLARLSRNASLSLSEQKKYKQLIEGQGLYLSDDDVDILTVHNFDRKLYGQNNAQIIEFYNSWCGFCQRFAPSWKALATDLREWKSMISVGAIDCSDEDNSPICREFEIMGYPTLRYFHENYQKGPDNIGVEVRKGDDVHSHRRNLLDKMIAEQKDGRGTVFPHLLPYSYSNTNYLFDPAPADTQYVFLIFENENSLYGPEVALDLHSVKHIVVRYASHNNTELAKSLDIAIFPSMVVYGKDETHHKKFDGTFNSREEFRLAIKQFLKPRGLEVPNPTPKQIYTGKWLEAPVPDMMSLMEAREFAALNNRISKMGDVVFQVDLETALRYSLKREVAGVKSITGEKLDALRSYLNILAKYFPLGRNGQIFLRNLKDIAYSKESVAGSEIANAVASVEDENRRVFSSPQQWLACRGSTPEHRGYPCGVWKMFHYLSVAALEQNSSEPREVLDAMLKYIKNFFGCADCSRHFQEMAAEKDMKGVSSLDSAILWLWMAHNDVNKRLAGDSTEDPKFPKIQFPSTDRCSSCRNVDATWNYTEVLKYVKQVYSSINVRYIGSDTRVLHMGLDGSHNTGDSGFFKSVDSSMSFILYLGSFILIIVLIRMFLKQGYRKKMYVHDLSGKV